jgi:hypothetical protein
MIQKIVMLILAGIIVFFSTIVLGTFLGCIFGEPQSTLTVNFESDCDQQLPKPKYLYTARF